MSTTIGAIGHACFGTASTTAAGLFALYVSQDAHARRVRHRGRHRRVGVLSRHRRVLAGHAAELHAAGEATSSSRQEGGTTRERLRQPVAADHAGILRHRTARARRLGAADGRGAGYRQPICGSTVRCSISSKTDDPDVRGTRLLEQHFEGVRPLEVSLSSPTQGRFFSSRHAQGVVARVGVDGAAHDVLSVTDPSLPFVQVWSALTDAPTTCRRRAAHAAQTRGARRT